MRPRCPSLLLLAVLLALAPGASAQQLQPAVDLDVLMARNLAPGTRLPRFLDEMRNAFTLFDLDRDGAITSADRERSLRRFAAAQRPDIVSQFLRADFDGDGVVTHEEVVRYESYIARISVRGEGPEIEAQRRQLAERLIAMRMRADLNGDGRIDWAEMMAYAKRAAEVGPQANFDAVYKFLLAFDADGDGKTTLAEFTAAMERRFAEVDTDGNGVISRAEFDSYWQRVGRPAPQVAEVQPNFEDKLADACAVPRASKYAKIVLFNGSNPEGLSTVAIGSQDEVTKASRVIIEPGEQPLYLVMIAHRRVLWKFEGAVERVQRVVLVAIAGSGDAPTPVGASGLSKDVITFGGPGNCMNFWVNMNSQYPDNQRRYSLLLFGREPDTVPETYEVWNLRLPSGRVSKPTEAEREKTFAIDNPTAIHLNYVRGELFQHSPGGLLPVDPAGVVAAVPFARYEVLPEFAGLAQLIIEGALERNNKGEFLIRKAMRFPAGLQMVTFRLLKGVPVPTGDPGSSSQVWSEDEGKYLCLSVHCKQRRN